jgi:hypothetical protein
MIAVTLMGGLGNQLFEYAFARSLSIKYQKDLKIDLSFLKRKDLGLNFVYRNYDLDLFHTIEDFKIGYESFIRIDETHFHYSRDIVDSISNFSSSNLILNGYWQSPKYFHGFESDIKSEFQFKKKIENSNDELIKKMHQKIQNENSIMVSVRRTDYLNSNFHALVGIDYFESAIEEMKSKVDNPHFFIFSDDIPWCHQNLKIDNSIFVDHSYSGEKFGYYLQLMSSCKNFIIPNSTFAWWSAWLCENENKIIISPKKWTIDDSIDTTDLIPKYWTNHLWI